MWSRTWTKDVKVVSLDSWRMTVWWENGTHADGRVERQQCDSYR